MTRSARQFLGAATLSGLTGRPVYDDMFEVPGELHVTLAGDSDLIVVAPATADLLARAAAGRADDLVTATLLCARCPVLMAPAMHPRMWQHPATRRNVRWLREVPGWQVLEPAFGEVASGERGVGRLPEPEDLLAAIEATLANASGEREAPPEASLEGRHVVVTAGPTEEDIDPVRLLTNRSSGKMGYAIARSAARARARVTLISGPVALETPPGVTRIDVRSALDMQAALQRSLGEGQRDADALIMCAAVSDYRPAAVANTKLKRTPGERSLTLVPNPDLLADVGRARGERRHPFLLGFAVETEQGERLEQAARSKLSAKRVDAVVANSAADALGTDATVAMIVTADGRVPLAGSKSSVAEAIVRFVAEQLA